MNMEQTISILIQIGGAAILLGLFYSLISIIHGFNTDEIKDMEREIAARRDVKQEQVAFLSRKNIEGAPLFSVDFEFIEQSLMKDAMTKVGGKSIPKALEPCLILESVVAGPIKSLAEPSVRVDQLVLTIQKESA